MQTSDTHTWHDVKISIQFNVFEMDELKTFKQGIGCPNRLISWRNTESKDEQLQQLLYYICISAVMSLMSSDCGLCLGTGIHLKSIRYILQALAKFKVELENDPIIKAHLESLYDKLLEGNLLRIIEPYSHVQVGHVAKLINLDNVSEHVHVYSVPF